MNKRAVCVIVLPLLLLGGVIDGEVQFSLGDLTIGQQGDYHTVNLTQCTPFTKPGVPELVTRYIAVVLPHDADVVGIEVLSYSRTEIPGSFQLLPVQHPPTFSRQPQEQSFVFPDENIYSRASEYPGELVSHLHTGSKGGFRIAIIGFFPLQYIPMENALILYSSIRFRIRYQEGLFTPRGAWLHEQAKHEKEVSRMVINPEDVPRWHPVAQPCPRVCSRTGQGLEFNNPEYIIMATDEFVSYFKPLKEWKTRKGVPTNLVNLGDVVTYPSATLDEKRIRDFIIEYNENHGTHYFLLVGDFETFPMKCINTIDDPNTPSDLWYADYDEDFFTNVYVGRASVNTQAEAVVFVEKVLNYEKETPTTLFHEKIFLPAYALWAGYGSPVNDSIAFHDPQSWQDAQRYDWQYPVTPEEVSDSFNVGFAYTNISAHGSWDAWGGSYSYHSIDDADSLSNAPPLTGVATAISCKIGELDHTGEDCYVEHMMNNPRGGTVAFVGNSRNGYGRIWNYGRSEWFCIWFYEQLAGNRIYNLGQTVAAAKDRCAMFAPGDPYVKHCMHTANLFGDPEMPLWLFTPRPLEVHHDTVIPVNTDTFTVYVGDGNAPLENVRVCVMSARDTLYRVAYTNSAGFARFPLALFLITDTCYVTVTHPDFLPYEGIALVTGPGIKEHSQALLPICTFVSPRPNPTMNRTTFQYILPHEMFISINIYNAIGQNVGTVIQAYQGAGAYQVDWEVKKQDVLSSGVFFVQFRAPDVTITHKLIVLGN